jgi:hypothetical protein
MVAGLREMEIVRCGIISTDEGILEMLWSIRAHRKWIDEVSHSAGRKIKG